MTAIASEIDDRLAAIDDAAFQIDVAGTAEGLDLDGDGSLDELRAGSWTGSLGIAGTREPITAARFTGAKVR
jgi:hypothetical protein